MLGLQPIEKLQQFAEKVHGRAFLKKGAEIQRKRKDNQLSA